MAHIPAKAALLSMFLVLVGFDDAAACVPMGAACGPTQEACCPGLFCSDPAGDGTCLVAGAAGEPCSPGLPCSEPLVCAEPELVCRHDPPEHDEPCSALVPCAEGLVCQAGTNRCVAAFATVGEGCTADTPCMEGLVCEPCLTDTCTAPFQCFPDPSTEMIDRARCLALYSPTLHRTAAAGGMAMTFGAGSAVDDDGVAWRRIGVAYGPDGRYGCFLTMCSGRDRELSIAPFVSLGSYETYDAVRGASATSVENAAIPALVSFSRSLVFRNPGGAEFESFLGTDHTVASGVSPDLGLIPIEAGDYVCETVLDTAVGNSPPVAVCADVMTCASAGACTASASIVQELFDPDGDMIGLVQEPAGPFVIGSHSVTFTAIDPDLAMSECTATVTVEDCAPPEVTCPAPTTAECQSGGQAVVDPGDASAHDCSSITVTDPGSSSYPMGTTSVSYSATDAAENRASCQTLVTVVDTTPPAISCPGTTTAECTGNEQARVDPGDAAASDCNALVVSDPGAATYRLGTTPVVYTATDSAGLSSTCTALVTVRDTGSPRIACPPDVVAECQGSQRALVDPGDAVATDDCSRVMLTDPGADLYPLGVSSVSYSATDTTGNAATCEMSVAVVDTLPPVIACPAPTTAECTGGRQAIVDPGDATVSDCTPTAVTDPGAASYPLGETPIIYVATDTGGRASACSTLVTIEDTTPPAIACPADAIVECQGVGGAWFDPGYAIATDICDDTTVSDPAPGMYALGATTVPYRAVDATGNAAECEATVSVVDTLPPTIDGISASPDRLWPPNHQMETIAVDIAASDVCDAAVSCAVVGATSDEPEDGLGDGDTPDDIELVDATTVRLRAERSGPGVRRTYTITVECVDATGGNRAQATTTVVVPHDQR